MRQSINFVFKSLTRPFLGSIFLSWKLTWFLRCQWGKDFSNWMKHASWLLIEKAKNTDVLNSVFLSPNQKGKPQVIFKEMILTSAQWSLCCMSYTARRWRACFGGWRCIGVVWGSRRGQSWLHLPPAGIWRKWKHT